MFDFTSGFWTWWIVVPSLGGILFCGWLVYWMSTGGAKPGSKVETMGHVWDEDLAELNNPLPSWWLYMFYGLLVVALVYLLLYPGLGAYRGLLGWSNAGQYRVEMQAAEARFGPLFEQYRQQDLLALASDPNAMATGSRLFATYCSICHGSDAQGAPGFPDLRDADWLWGGEPEAIKASILQGRVGNMPAWDAVLGREGVYNVAEYVRGLSGREVNTERAQAGKLKFQQLCTSCHGPEGRGNQMLGAPDLTDDIWLYGRDHDALLATIANGRQGNMPAHGSFLGEAKVHLLAAYVYGLGKQGGARAAATDQPPSQVRVAEPVTPETAETL